MFVGGGNSFRLLSALYRTGLREALIKAVAGGLPYMGAGAGTNMAAPSLRTTNDMPIVEPPSFETLGLVPFQINPHYLDPDPASTHKGETREERLREFPEENDVPVLGLREGSWLRVEGERAVLGGERDARLFRRGAEPRELSVGAGLSELFAVRGEFDARSRPQARPGAVFDEEDRAGGLLGRPRPDPATTAAPRGLSETPCRQ